MSRSLTLSMNARSLVVGSSCCEFEDNVGVCFVLLWECDSESLRWSCRSGRASLPAAVLARLTFSGAPARCGNQLERRQ